MAHRTQPVTALEAIQQGAEKRAAKYHTNYVPRLFPDLERANIPGSYSITYAGKPSRRDVLSTVAIDTGVVLETPSAIARDYLAWRYHRGPIWKTSQDIALSGYRMPCFCKPTLFEYGEYVDIKSAWWSIISICGWDTDIWPNRWWRFGRPPYDYPYPTNSRGRNCLVSVALSRDIRWWRPELGKVVKVPAYNRLYNRSVYVAIACVLSAIAEECRLEGAVYWNTDGAICPSAHIAQRVEDVIVSWGLTSSVKYRGRGFCASVGHYVFDHTRTGCRKWHYHESSHTNDVDLGWVKARWLDCLRARASAKLQGASLATKSPQLGRA